MFVSEEAKMNQQVEKREVSYGLDLELGGALGYIGVHWGTFGGYLWGVPLGGDIG